MKKPHKRKKRTKIVVLPTGQTTTANSGHGDIIWYSAAPKSFVQTTLDYMKRWFK